MSFFAEHVESHGEYEELFRMIIKKNKVGVAKYENPYSIFQRFGEKINISNGKLLSLLKPPDSSTIFFVEHFLFQPARQLGLGGGNSGYCRSHNVSRTLPPRRIAAACIAMLFMGAGQIFMVLPTQLAADAVLSPVAGTGVIFCTNVVFFAVWCIISGMPEKIVMKKSAVYGLVWGVIAVLSFCVLLQTLRMLGEIRQAGIVFPVGAGVLIVSYTAFTAIFYHEKLNFKQILAFGAVICGILMSKLG